MYFPKSQIKPNLYTNGGEYVLSTTKQDYKGYYYEVSTGQKFTGKTPQDGPNTPLINTPKLNQHQSPEYQPINLIQFIGDIPPNSTIYSRSIPQPNPTFPTNQDIELGVYTRYFCKKNNELKYMEIDKLTHDKLKSKQQDIAWDLYTPISTLWYLRGGNGSSITNKGLISLIERDQKWYGFTQWFQDKF